MTHAFTTKQQDISKVRKVCDYQILFMILVTLRNNLRCLPIYTITSLILFTVQQITINLNDYINTQLMLKKSMMYYGYTHYN